MGVRRATLLVLTLFVALLAAPAEAALWMEFEPARARPGTTVVGHTVGNGAMRAGEGPFAAFLVPAGTNDKMPIGNVVVDARDNGTLRFEVPDVPGGNYEIWIECEPCAPYSAGRTELPVGEFRVLGAAMLPPVEPSQSTFTSILLLATMCALLAGLMLYRARRRPASPPAPPVATSRDRAR